jgi:hypothetical protein
MFRSPELNPEHPNAHPSHSAQIVLVAASASEWTSDHSLALGPSGGKLQGIIPRPSRKRNQDKLSAENSAQPSRNRMEMDLTAKNAETAKSSGFISALFVLFAVK